tara:strand:- start:2579 stop:4231 length:1653 start_codon:yes stop_codon:yes gene_type:complete
MSSFNKYNFNENLLKSIKDLNFNKPTPIQDKVIPEILSLDKDIIATAQTGTGKTAAFGLPIIQLTDNKNKDIECIILCPTRELCLQITKELNSYCTYMKYYRIVAIYGGAKVETQIKNLKKNPKIIVCTPGRLNDLIKRKRMDFSLVKYFVLDEADEMLSMGFKSEIDKILKEIPLDRKIYLFSATLSAKVKKITETYMSKPLMIATSSANKGAETIKHIYCISTKSKRYDLIKNIIDINQNIYTIIFCRTRRETNDISNKLIKDNYNAKVLNGDLSQNERDRVMRQFREKNINILVATDVASRGIDVNNLSHIINYNLPDDPEVYVHRSGRTGRAGKEGISIALVSKREYKRLREIEKLSKISFTQIEAPTDTEVFKSQIKSFTDRIINISLPNEKEKEMFKDFYNKLNSFTKEEIIGKIISMNIESSDTTKINTNNKKSSKNEMVDIDTQISKLIINVGRLDRMNPQELIRLINKTIRSRDTEIGKIDIQKSYSTFEVDSKAKKMIISKMKHIRHNRKLILVSIYNPDLIDISKNKKHKSKKRRRRKK